MTKYKAFLIDLDHTLYDFNQAEYHALQETFKKHQIPFESYKRYQEINMSYWKQFEAGEISKDVFLVKRFQDLLDELCLPIDAKIINHYYLTCLGEQGFLFPGAKELLKKLYKMGKVIIATNGAALTQHKKVETSGIIEYIDDLVISDETGYQKPHPEFFHYILKKHKLKPWECIMIGDNPKVDIDGANALGIPTILVDLENKYQEFSATYKVTHLLEVLNIV